MPIGLWSGRLLQCHTKSTTKQQPIQYHVLALKLESAPLVLISLFFVLARGPGPEVVHPLLLHCCCLNQKPYREDHTYFFFSTTHTSVTTPAG